MVYRLVMKDTVLIIKTVIVVLTVVGLCFAFPPLFLVLFIAYFVFTNIR